MISKIEFAHSIRQMAHFVTESLLDIMSQKDFLLDLDQPSPDDTSPVTNIQTLLTDVDHLCREELCMAKIELVQELKSEVDHIQIASAYLKQALFALIQEVTQAAVFYHMGGQNAQHLHITVDKAADPLFVSLKITCHLPIQQAEMTVAQDGLEVMSGDSYLSPGYKLLAQVVTYHQGHIQQILLGHRQQQISISLPIISRHNCYMPLPGYELLSTKILQ